jgi:hypothetical protein
MHLSARVRHIDRFLVGLHHQIQVFLRLIRLRRRCIFQDIVIKPILTMQFLKAVRLRKPAIQLADIDVPDTVWQQDFDLVDRYQAFANELMRIALLGIGGYGFLIKEMLTGDNKICHLLLSENKIYVSAGAICLMISLSLVLGHRFSSTACLYHQILIVRSLKRLGNPGWTDDEKKEENRFLKRTRSAQQTNAIISRGILIGSAFFFGVGFLCVIIVFLHALRLA